VLRTANEILKKASAYFAQAELDRPFNVAVKRDPLLASDRARRDAIDSAEIERVHDESRGRYGARKIWHQLRREGKDIARCTVERLMKAMGLQGVVRGKRVITTNPDTAQPCPDDKVNRGFKAQSPNQLWVSDFTYVSTWQGMVYVAFVVDVFSRRIVGWRVSTSMTTAFVLDALNQAICQRSPEKGAESEPSEIPTIMHLLKASLACSKLRSQSYSAHGNQWASLNGKR